MAKSALKNTMRMTERLDVPINSTPQVTSEEYELTTRNLTHRKYQQTPPPDTGKRLVEACKLAEEAGMDSFWVWLWVEFYIAQTQEELLAQAAYIRGLHLDKFNRPRLLILRQLFEDKQKALDAEPVADTPPHSEAVAVA